MAQVGSAEAAIGFYTVEQSEVTGWTGGLLVLGASGRPLEFQCTLPVRPSRCHEILYGVSLRDYLIGDAIGGLLLSRCRQRPLIVCCDQVEALQLASRGGCPMALVCEAAEGDEGPIADDMLPDHGVLQLAGATLRVAVQQSEEAKAALQRLHRLADLIEPFSRIREAIGEAQRQVARARQGAAA